MILKKVYRDKLDTCHKDLIRIFDEYLKTGTIKIGISCGYRSPEEQLKLYNIKSAWKTDFDGYNKLSKHNHKPSLAVDIFILTDDNKADWTSYDKYTEIYTQIKHITDKLITLGEIKHNIRWGGNFRGRKKDYVHFELI